MTATQSCRTASILACGLSVVVAVEEDLQQASIALHHLPQLMVVKLGEMRHLCPTCLPSKKRTFPCEKVSKWGTRGWGTRGASAVSRAGANKAKWGRWGKWYRLPGGGKWVKQGRWPESANSPRAKQGGQVAEISSRFPNAWALCYCVVTGLMMLCSCCQGQEHLHFALLAPGPVFAKQAYRPFVPL